METPSRVYESPQAMRLKMRLASRKRVSDGHPQGSVLPVLMANWKCIQHLPIEPPIRHEAVHQDDETATMCRFDEMRHLMHDDVLKALFRLLCQFGVQSNSTCARVAASPLGLHLLYVKPINGYSHHRCPSGYQRRKHRLHLLSVPPRNDGLLLLSSYSRTTPKQQSVVLYLNPRPSISLHHL